MAVSAFKSTSRRGNLASSTTNTSSSSSSSTTIHPPRRSRSVSAVSRDQLDTADFLNKRDNPLFWTTTNTLPPENPVQSQNATDSESKFERKASKFSAPNSEVVDATRGRSVSRTSSAGNQIAGGGKGIGRSRSVSRRPVPRGNHWSSESEVEQECSLSVNSRNRRNLNLAPNNGKRANLIRPSSEFSDQINNTQTRSSQHWPSELSDRSASGLQIPNSEDEFSVGSFSEAEEKTIKAVCEQIKSFQRNDLEGDNTASGIYETVRSEVRRAISDIQNDLESAIRRNNAAGIATTNVTDIPPDLVNPGAVELVLDIREEYAKKLEQSQERARKLRADLAVEEHRGQELSRILKEILPEPKITTAPKSRMGRKTSIERRKMSKRLTEEAMAYFDECVSISTFDSSDFSSPEDPPLNLVGATTSVGDSGSLPQGSPNVSTSYCHSSCLNPKQESSTRGQSSITHEDSCLTMKSSSNEAAINEDGLNGAIGKHGQKFQFSISRKPSGISGFQQDIRNYVKKFEKDGGNQLRMRSNYYDIDDYNLKNPAQNLLFDRVFYKNRIESGSLLLCGGGTAVSASPFASVI